jgi:hypothetical protein
MAAHHAEVVTAPVPDVAADEGAKLQAAHDRPHRLPPPSAPRRQADVRVEGNADDGVLERVEPERVAHGPGGATERILDVAAREAAPARQSEQIEERGSRVGR